MDRRRFSFIAFLGRIVLTLVAGQTGISAMTSDGVLTAAQASVDLHSHLFMKEGMKFLLTGDANEEPRAKHWRSLLSTKISIPELERTELKLVVVSFYAHPWIAFPHREALKKQAQAVQDFVRHDSRWRIARSAREAREGLKAGKKILVLSVEGGEGLFENALDRQFWLETVGIRIVTPMHLTPDSLGGVALLGGVGMVNAPWAWFLSLATGHRDPSGVYLNPNGVKGLGKQVVSDLVRAGVWIDLTHASDQAQKEIWPIARAAGQPALYTHTALRKYLRSERGISEEQLGWVRESRGVLGLIPAENMMEPQGAFDPVICSRGLGAAKLHWVAASLATFPEAVQIGSDFNGPLRGLSPDCWEEVAEHSEIPSKGFYRGSQIPELLRALGETRESNAKKLEYFLQAWERVRPQSAPRAVN